VTSERAPRPYSTLRGDKIVWVTPEEHADPTKKRSRLESDSEVRKRLSAAADDFWAQVYGRPTYTGVSGPALDQLLHEKRLPPRGYVDDDA